MHDIGKLLIYAFEIVVAVYGGVLVWLIRRILTMDRQHGDDMAEVRTNMAVLSSTQEDLKENSQRTEKQNREDHQQMLDRIDDHHAKLTDRIDTVIKLIQEK